MGPGFDCIGMALDIWNELTVERGPFSIEMVGEGSDARSMPHDSRNFVVTGAEAAFRAAGTPLPDLSYRCVNEIPYSRGVGSSSAAIVAGLMAGAALAGLEIEDHRLVGLAADIDGHPDNVGPALMGGCCVGVHTDSRWVIDSIPVPDELRAVLFTPDIEGPTREARALLRPEVSRADAIFNIGRSALLVNALAHNRLDLLRYATEDRLHQPDRGKVYPALKLMITAALNAGAHGAFLSGAGPGVIALTTKREMTVGYEMTEAARLHGVPGRVIVTKPTTKGAYIACAE